MDGQQGTKRRNTLKGKRLDGKAKNVPNTFNSIAGIINSGGTQTGTVCVLQKAITADEAMYVGDIYYGSKVKGKQGFRKKRGKRRRSQELGRFGNV